MKRILLCLLIAGSFTTAFADENLKQQVDESSDRIESKVIEWRRHFHQFPELSNREFKTAEKVAEHLKNLGLDVRTAVAHTGVVGVLKGGKGGPVVALRADMDALPLRPEFSTIVDRGERFFALDCVLYLYRFPGGLTGAQRYRANRLDWNLILREVNQHYDRQVAMVKLSTAAEREAQAEVLAEEDRRSMDKVTGKHSWIRILLYRLGGRLTQKQFNQMGSQAIRALVTSSVGAGVVWMEVEVQHSWFDVFKVACALSAYRADKGKFPDSLAQISPSYLKEIPLDRFTDKPLIYKPQGKGYLLYSAGGPNMKDDGGANDQTDKADDLTVEMRAGDGR